MRKETSIDTNIMKRIFTIIAAAVAIMLATGEASAQENSEKMTWSEGWRYAFSKEGVKEWRPEFTLRYYAGLFDSGHMYSAGVRVDDKRTFGLIIGHGDTYIDYAPADIYHINASLLFRRYFHLGKRQRFAIYSDLYAGAAFIHKIDGKYSYYPDGTVEENIEADKGDAFFILGWQPGIRVRCYKNLHVFLGPTISSHTLGLHLGIGF